MSRANAVYLPGVELPSDVEPLWLDDVQWAEVEVVFLALPSHALAEGLAGLADRIPRDAGVVALTKGLVGPAGELPAWPCARPRGSARSHVSAAPRTPSKRCSAALP